MGHNVEACGQYASFTVVSQCMVEYLYFTRLAICVTPIAYSTTMRNNSTRSLAIAQCGDIAFPYQNGLLLKERIRSKRSEFFPLKVAPILKKGHN